MKRRRINKLASSFARITFTVLICSLLLSCTANRYLPKGEVFYEGAEIKFNTHQNAGRRGAIRKDLEVLAQPKRNTKILGMRPGVWIYYAVGNPEKKKGLRAWAKRKLGEEPVLLSDVKEEQMADLFQGTLFNDGYFESQVSAGLRRKRTKGYAVYTIDLYPPFRIAAINYPHDSIFTPLTEEIAKKSLLKKNDRYNLATMKTELARIEGLVENYGYYYFDDRYLLFEADTTIGHHKVDLTLTLIPGTPEKMRRKYVMKNVTVINDYYLQTDTLPKAQSLIAINGFHYFSTKDDFRPKIITNAINLRRGSLYRRDDHNYTISHLMSLGAFKFVNIKYREAPDSLNGLEANVYLTPMRKKSIRMEAQGTSKSNNFVGPGVGLTFTNRNFLGGAERFELKLNGSYEWQIGNKQSSAVNAVELSTEASLTVPRMLVPVRIYNYSSKYLPRTTFKTGLEFQRRVGYYQMNSFNVGFGYTWRETTSRSHDFFPVEVNYVKVSRITDEFQELLDNNPTLENSFQDQFIPGMRYSFTLNTQLKDQDTPVFGERKTSRSNFYFRGNLSLSGNLLRLIQKTGKPTDAEQPYDFLGQPYSQFILGDVDFRYFLQLDKHNKLATRIAVGTGYAYGNSTTLPYIKQFASGGSSSVRAFPARSIGPGTYNVYDDADYDDSYFVDQRADIKLEGNVEFRFDIYKSLKGAWFTDAGNVWLWKEDTERPGAKFNSDTFIKELAVGTGLGLRLDFNFFILRFDVAFPIRKPWLPENNRWVFDEINFGSKNWRKENLIFNIAIGYPF